jgi:Mor family transcriptional regulator
MSWRDGATPLLVEMADHAAAALADGLGLDRAQAEYAGYLVMCRIIEHIGGANVYLPKIDSVQRHERDLKIWAHFDGRNHAELARTHGVTTVHVYRLVKRMRARHAEQLSLPQLTPGPIQGGK